MKMCTTLGMVASLLAATALAQDDVSDAAAAENISPTAPTPGGKFPRYGSLKKTEVNVRSGPGNQYPILWVYQRAGYPVQLLARYDNYYKLRDVEGEEGWAYIGMVSPKQTALVGGKEPTMLRRHEAPDSPVVARLAPGVVVELVECTDSSASMCKIETGGFKGWVSKRGLDMVE